MTHPQYTLVKARASLHDWAPEMAFLDPIPLVIQCQEIIPP
jgi:hypothetical protein